MSSSLSLSLVLFATSLSTSATTLTVAAASDLSSLQTALTAAFQTSHPGIQIRFVSAASGVLAQQIENGAPYDVFLSANARFADALAAKGKLAPASLQNYATGRVAFLWRDGKQHPISELATTSVKFIALPNPALAPYGQAAQQSLENAGLWQKVRSKVVYGENVRQTLQLFTSGNADVVFTAHSLVSGRHPQLLPSASHEPVVQKAGLVVGTQNQKAAEMFLKFLQSKEARALFARYGFDEPPE